MITVRCFITQGERGLSLSMSIKVRNGNRPTQTDSVKEDICEWQSVSRESRKKRMTFLWREVSAPGGAGKGTVSPSLQWPLLSCTRKLSAIFQADCLSFNLPLSSCLSATSLSPTPTPSHAVSPSSLLPLSSFSLALPPSLCQLQLKQIDCRCASPATEDSLMLRACSPCVWHSTFPNLLSHNLSTDPRNIHK